MANVTFRSAAFYKETYSTVNGTVNKPAGTTSGDLVILTYQAAQGTTPPEPTPPAGFTKFATHPTLGLSWFSIVWQYWKIAGGSEPATYAFTNASTEVEIVALSYYNTDQTAPIGVSPVYDNGSTGPTSTALSISTTINNTMVVIVGQDWGTTSNTLSAPSGTTPTFAVRATCANTSLTYVADGLLATAGSTGDKTFTSNSGTGTYPWSTAMFGIIPPASTTYVLAKPVRRYLRR